MNAEFFTALDLLEKTKGIPKEYMIEKVEAALISAFKKEYGTGNVRVTIDPEKKDVRVYECKDIVEAVEDPATQISLEEAKSISRRYTLGGVVEKEVKTKRTAGHRSVIRSAVSCPYFPPDRAPHFSERFH